MDLQICHCCGWSKVTTYQGLRIHQGKMGCTPKGVKVAEPEQQYMWDYVGYANTQMDIKLDVCTSIKTETTDYYSNLSLQVCYCGWSKMTTYQGLRIHQGKMGCTSKGMRIPKTEQYDWKNQKEAEVGHRKHWPAKKATVKKENFSEPPRKPRSINSAATATMTEEYRPTASARAQRSSQRVSKSKSDYHLQEYSTLPQVNRPTREYSAPTYPGNVARPKEKKIKQKTTSETESSSTMPGYWSVDRSIDFAITASKIKEEPKSPHATSHPSFQRATSCQQQEFFTDVKVKRSVREPSPLLLETAELHKKKDRKAQTQEQPKISSSSSTATTSSIRDEYRSPTSAHAQCSSQKANNSKSDQQLQEYATLPQIEDSSRVAGYLTIDHSTEYRQPKSTLAAPPPSFQRPTSLKQQEFSANVQKRSGVDPPTTPPLEAAILPKKEHKKDQTQVKRCIEEPPPASLEETAVLSKNEDWEDQTQSASQTKEAITEEPRSSFTASLDFLKKASDSIADHQLQDFSTSKQLNKSVRDHPPPVPPKKKDSTSFKERLERIKASLQPNMQTREEKNSKINPVETDCKNFAVVTPWWRIQGSSQKVFSVPDSNTKSQKNSATADVSLKEDSTQLYTAAEASFPTAMKVKELAQMFSAAAAKGGTGVPPNEKHSADHKLSQVKVLAQRFSTITVQETAVKAKEKNGEEQKPIQMLPESTSAATKINSAAAKPTPEEDPKALCENTQLSGFSSGLKVKDLARMFSGATTLEKGAQLKKQQREEQKPAQVKLLVQKLSAKETQGLQKEKNKEDQKHSKN